MRALTILTHLAFALVVVSGQTTTPQVRKFVDDHGVEHVTDKAKPTFLARARFALFFHHHGVGTEQIRAIYGNWFTRGSPMDLSNPQTSERYAVDPTPEDVAFLETLPNLSPTCYDEPKGCQVMDLDLFRALNPLPDFWLYIDNGGTDDWDGFFTGFIGNITETMGKPPIFIDTAFEHGHGCRDSTGQKFAYQTNDADSCYSRSLIDVHKRLEELAVFLGVDLEGSDSFSDGQQDMCEAAARFSNAAQAAHNRGIRVALAWFNILPDSVYVAPFSPLADTFARTLEELGMPIVHAGLCTNKPCNSGLYGPDYEIINASTWFVECTEGQAFTSCNGRTLYNIDLWMLGGRELQSVINGRDFFATNFPDRAILAGQYVDIPMNDGTISYHNIARFLDNMAEQLENAQPMYGSSKDCASVDVSSKEHLRASNLIDFSSVPPGQIACYNKAFHQTAYLMCPPKKGGDSGAGVGTTSGAAGSTVCPWLVSCSSLVAAVAASTISASLALV